VVGGWRRLHEEIHNLYYEGVPRSFRTGRLEREMQMVELSATRCSLVSLAAITLCVASQRVFVVVSAYFVIHSDRKLWDTPSYDDQINTVRWAWHVGCIQRLYMCS
jgi:hypothetical protein